MAQMVVAYWFLSLNGEEQQGTSNRTASCLLYTQQINHYGLHSVSLCPRNGTCQCAILGMPHGHGAGHTRRRLRRRFAAAAPWGHCAMGHIARKCARMHGTRIYIICACACGGKTPRASWDRRGAHGNRRAGPPAFCACYIKVQAAAARECGVGGIVLWRPGDNYNLSNRYTYTYTYPRTRVRVYINVPFGQGRHGRGWRREYKYAQ